MGEAIVSSSASSDLRVTSLSCGSSHTLALLSMSLHIGYSHSCKGRPQCVLHFVIRGSFVLPYSKYDLKVSGVECMAFATVRGLIPAGNPLRNMHSSITID